MGMPRLKWVAWRVGLDCDPLPLSELFPVGRATDVGSVTGDSTSTEWVQDRVMNRLVVDVIPTFGSVHKASPAAASPGMT
jgi:hypothetical protein